MKVSSLVNLVKNSPLKNTIMNYDNSNILYLIYLGVVDLTNRFNLSIKAERVLANPQLGMYELRNTDVDMLLEVYDECNTRMVESDVLNDIDCRFKILTYNSFIYKANREEYLTCIYKATIPEFTSNDDEVNIPSSMLPALIQYVGYVALNSFSSDDVNQRAVEYAFNRYIKLCNDLELQGYKVNIFNESLYGKVKGYI